MPSPDSSAPTRRADLSVDAQEFYHSRLTSAEAAVACVKPGDRVVFCRGREPESLGRALAARREQLEGVKVWVPQPGRDFGWYADPSSCGALEVSVGFVTNLARRGVQEGFVDYCPHVDFTESAPELGTNPSYGADVYLVEVSPPDERGFCSFGNSLWDKPKALRSARTVLAEVNPRMIRTYGENFVHVSQIDHFVENPSPSRWNISRTPREEAPPLAARVAELIGGLIHDGDTLQLGLGRMTEWIPRTGVLDNHVDLGLHTELTPRGVTPLVRGGVINNKRKTLHAGHCVSTACGGSREDVQYIDGNPLFHLYSAEYVIHPLTIAKLDHFVAVNQALAVDLSGQATAESMGALQWAAPGGQPAIAMGALMAPGGRSIMVVPSTSSDGQHSRIVAHLPEGSAVTIPRYLADMVVSEYGVARLRWKTLRERARALIAIAHPDFRSELEAQARHLL